MIKIVVRGLLFSFILVSIYVFGFLLPAEPVSAFDYPRLSNRSLTMATAGLGQATSYTMTWRWPSSVNVGSVRLVLCSDPYVLDPCSNTPDGDFSSASLVSQSGATGFNIVSQSTSEMLLSRPVAPASTAQSTYIFDGVVNPSGIHSVFYVQVMTYPTSDGSGLPNYMSSLAGATSAPIMINAKVPPILYFCAALTVDEWCENINGNFIDYGSLDSSTGHSATSQFGVATNATGGYIVTVNGDTMTSGNKKIDALDTPAAYNVGQRQFGINLRANTSPALGQDVTGSGVGVVATDYDMPDLFKFRDGDLVASANTGSLFNTYTVTYVVNLPDDLPSGVYNTTLAYICTAAF